MRKDFMRRNSFIYKFKFWLYRLNRDDVVKCIRIILFYGFEVLMCALALGLLFFIPAFLR